MIEVNDCVSCGSSKQFKLPLPNLDNSVLSDGRIIPRSLAKTICLECGLVTREPRLLPHEIRQFYDGNYDLGANAAIGDFARGLAYSKIVAELVGHQPINRILEVGCGAGHTLVALSAIWREAFFMGLEAAPQLAGRTLSDSPSIELRQGFIENMQGVAEGFDLVFSVNVVEHAADVVNFLFAMAQQLATTGRIVLICPRLDPPNLELLFVDHIHSFSAAAMENLATKAGLTLERYLPDGYGLGDFQIFVFCPKSMAASGVLRLGVDGRSSGDLAIACGNYLDAWKNLDQYLLRRVARMKDVLMFGAGEVAALLRCYAPQTWSRASKLVVDDTKGARDLSRPVVQLLEVTPSDELAIIIATHPRSQRGIAERLNTLGHRTVTFDELISR